MRILRDTVVKCYCVQNPNDAELRELRKIGFEKRGSIYAYPVTPSKDSDAHITSVLTKAGVDVSYAYSKKEPVPDSMVLAKLPNGQYEFMEEPTDLQRSWLKSHALGVNFIPKFGKYRIKDPAARFLSLAEEDKIAIVLQGGMDATILVRRLVEIAEKLLQITTNTGEDNG